MTPRLCVLTHEQLVEHVRAIVVGRAPRTLSAPHGLLADAEVLPESRAPRRPTPNATTHP